MKALIDPKTAPLPPEKFSAISAKTMTLGEIVSILGPAQKDIGSGIYVLEWRSTDGRSFIVGAADLKDLTRSPMYAHWEK